MALDQATRTLELTTPLGDNELLLTSFRGEEAISRLFHFELELISDNNNITAADIVGKNVTFSIKLADDSPRFFNGFVNRFQAGDEDENGRRDYRAEVVPWMWFLTQTTDCRIFQNKTVVEIIEQIFQDLEFTDYETSEIKGDHKTWEYCVQYRETDFNFVTRLMEQEGIFFFFRHEDGKHVMVLSDDKSAYFDCDESEVDYPRDYGTRPFEDHLTSWIHDYSFCSGKWAQTDYNFKTPSTDLMSQTDTVVDLPDVDKYEIYDFPGEYEDTGVGSGEIKIRMEEEETAHNIVQAGSLCKTFSPGGKFTVREHRSSSEEGNTYVITSIEHTAYEASQYETGATVGQEYTNSIHCIPDSVIFRPPRTTPKPIVSGVQTAMVVGPSGEEIYVDEYGRVKVQFHWDREGEEDENSSCWIRVSQNWAGKNWGLVCHPRIGQEVVIDFLEGDPDRPMINGRLYNAEQMPPYTLPENKTQTGIKTRSTMEGDAENFNEIRFEDEKGEEEVYVHAEKDMNIVVENDESRLVERDRKKTVERNEDVSIGANRTENVGKNEQISIGENRTESVGKDETIAINGKRSKTVEKDENSTINGKRTERVEKDEEIVIGGKRKREVGGAEEIEVAEDRKVTVGTSQTIEIGEKLQITAGDEIVFSTGDASITLKSDGKIEIKGSDIKLQGTGKINLKADSDVVIKGSNVKNN